MKFWEIYRIINFLLIVVALFLQFIYSAQEEKIYADQNCTATETE
jgi:hypothetical protein